MEIQQVETKGVKMIVVRGELVRENQAAFLEEMELRMGTDKNVVLNLWDLEFIDSAGIGALVTVAAHLRRRERVLWLYRINPKIKRVLENTHVLNAFRVTMSPAVINGTLSVDPETVAAAY